MVHGDDVEGALEGVLAEVGVLLGRPGGTAGQVIGRTRPWGNGRGETVEGVRLGYLHEIHEIALVEGWGGKEVGAVKDVLAAGRVGIDHWGGNARIHLQ